MMLAKKMLSLGPKLLGPKNKSIMGLTKISKMLIMDPKKMPITTPSPRTPKTLGS